jgi:ankyrin repeat protein
MPRVPSSGKLPTRSKSHRLERNQTDSAANATFVDPSILKSTKEKKIKGDAEPKRNDIRRTHSSRSVLKTADVSSDQDMANAIFTHPVLPKSTIDKKGDNESKRRGIRRSHSARSNLTAEKSDQAMERALSSGSLSSRRSGISRTNSDRSKTLNATFPDPTAKSKDVQQQLFNLTSSSHSNRSRKTASQPKVKNVDEITPDPSWTPLYLYARQANWKAVSRQCRKLPRDAKCVDPTDGTTALHLAVISRTNPTFRNLYEKDTPPAPLELIEELAAACPEAGIIRCHLKSYTPLCYACSVYEREYNLQNAKLIARILLEHAPHSAYVFTDDGLSALDVHILKCSRLFKKEPKTDSTIVLKALLDAHPRLAKTRCYNDKVRGPIEMLYRSNREKFKKIASKKESPDSWWAWTWVNSLLRSCSGPSRTNALHSASGVNGCPVAILKIAAQNYPQYLSQPVDESGNTPLHEVCMWIDEQNEEEMTEFINQRKREAIQCLLRLNSKVCRMKNIYGETPLQLAIESQTPYQRGIQALVRSYPGALSVPRSLRSVEDENAKLLSVDLYNDNESVDSEWENPVLAVEGMFPFMVAAVVAVEPASWGSREIHLHGSSSVKNAEQMKKKTLASLDTIYGLLRAKPSMLGLYKPVYVRLDFSESEEYTDEYVEETESEYTEVTQEDEDDDVSS